MLASYPVRMRSHSSPLRPNPDTDTKLPAKNPQNAASSSPSRFSHPHVPVPSTNASPIFREESPSRPKEKPLAVIPSGSSPSQPRKIFRLKRPSSSSSAQRPTYERGLLGLSSSFSRDGSSAPPRPPRNPRRPQTASGVIPSQVKNQASALQSRSPMRSFLPSDSLAFPLSPAADAHPPPQRRNSRRKTGPPPTQPSISEHPQPTGFQFSTADRTILAELKQKIHARDSQFKIRNHKKHHPHAATEVPYPTCYDRRVLDNDIWETKSFQEACGSVTWHTFEDPPLRVLDLGCGAGTWLLDCARAWKDTTFVGLDIVPLHPDLQQVGSSQLASRITWVQANFLEPLPFQDDEFDYIHIKRISRGVPEDKWDALFEQISRVLKPGGALEIIEEDLYFPGSLRNPRSAYLSSYGASLSPEPQVSSRPRAPTPLSSFYSQANNGSVVSAHEALQGFPLRPTVAPRSLTEPLMPLLSRSPTEYTEATLVEPDNPPVARTSDQASHSSVPQAPVNPRDHTVLEFIYDEMHAARFINLEPLSLLANTLSLYFKDMRTHPPVLASFPPLSPDDALPVRSRLSSHSGGPWDKPHTQRRPHASDASSHSGSRVLASGITTPERRPSVTADGLRTGQSQFLTLDDSRLDAFSPSPHASFPSPLQKTPSSSRLRRSSNATTPFLGDSKEFPSFMETSVSFPKLSEKRKISRLPNPKFEFDVGLLNLHLLLRTEEIIGCAEAMWDWILDYQQMHPSRTRFAVQRRPVHAKMSRKPTSEPMHNILLELTRGDFDTLLQRFEFDMKDCMGLGSAVENRLGWARVPSSPSDSRREFDTLCDEWARFLLNPAESHQPRPMHTLPLAANESTAILSLLGGMSEDGHSSPAYSHWDGTDSSGSHPQSQNQNHHVHPVKEKTHPGVIVTKNAARSDISHDGQPSTTSQEYLHAPTLHFDDPDEPMRLPPSERQCRTFRVMVAWKA